MSIADRPPFVGALLRLCLGQVRGRMLAAIRAAGFADLQDAHLAIFSYPLPDGTKPSELARRIGMSRQATNHLIAQLEALGYVERRAPEGSSRRLVHLTGRGWQVGRVIVACVQQIQADWALQVGPERFADFLDVLRLLAAGESGPAQTSGRPST